MLWLVLACAAPDPRPAAALVGTAGPIARVATLAGAAVRGDAVSCAETVECATDPCVTAVTITLGDTCPLPTGDAFGEVLVAGTWDADGTAVLAADFSGVSPPLWVQDVSAFTVTPAEDGLDVAWAMESVSVTEGETGDEVGVAQTGLAVHVANGGTAADLADDRITVSGGGQWVDGGDIWQVVVSEAEIGGECLENPVGGWATVEDVSEGSQGVTTWSFHPACDGTATVSASVGTGSAWSGKDVVFPALP